MKRHDPDEIIARAEQSSDAIADHYLPAVEWFLDETGMAPRAEVVADLAEHLRIEESVAESVVSHLVADEVDPVQQVVQPAGDRFVGVISHAEHDWFYAFDIYDDVEGRKRRAVCAHCVQAGGHASDAAHFTRVPGEYHVDAARLALALHYHVAHEDRSVADALTEELGVDAEAFADRHDLGGSDALTVQDVTRRFGDDPDLETALSAAADRVSVPEVETGPGATLASGTTVAGNDVLTTADSIDADTLDGYEATELPLYTTGIYRTTVTIASGSYTTASITRSLSFDASQVTTWTLRAYQGFGGAFAEFVEFNTDNYDRAYYVFTKAGDRRANPSPGPLYDGTTITARFEQILTPMSIGFTFRGFTG